MIALTEVQNQIDTKRWTRTVAFAIHSVGYLTVFSNTVIYVDKSSANQN